MGHFDKSENRVEKEIYYKKFISAFSSLVNDHLKSENGFEDKEQDTAMTPVMPTSIRNCRP
jgi:hypothetical protein